jgi:hypothetical protein
MQRGIQGDWQEHDQSDCHSRAFAGMHGTELKKPETERLTDNCHDCHSMDRVPILLGDEAVGLRIKRTDTSQIFCREQYRKITRKREISFSHHLTGNF